LKNIKRERSSKTRGGNGGRYGPQGNEKDEHIVTAWEPYSGRELLVKKIKPTSGGGKREPKVNAEKGIGWLEKQTNEKQKEGGTGEGEGWIKTYWMKRHNRKNKRICKI